MTINRLESKRLRRDWRELLQTLQKNKREIVITEGDEPVATIISYEDYLVIRDELEKRRQERGERSTSTEAWETMLASETVLAREWDTEEEDEAWADL